MRILVKWFVATLLCSLSVLANAHKMAPSLLLLDEIMSGEFSVHWKTPLVQSSPVRIDMSLPAHCLPSSDRQPKPDPVGAVFEWTVDCGEQGLVGHDINMSGLRENQSAAVMKLSLLDGRAYQHVINASNPSYTVPERVSSSDVFWEYLKLGVEHILAGIDHLFFVWALILLLAKRKLLIAITAFTLGHSITLALAALDVITVPQTLTELFIAFSIFVLAVEIAADKGEQSLVRRHAFWVCVAFGLLHGLGFAGALKEIGLPQEEVAVALLTFNIGVEVGQILFVVVVLAAAWVLKQVASKVLPAVLQPERLIWVPVYIIGTGAAFWCVERSLGLLI